MELYAVMGEHDNSGIPLAYCLLTTTTSICPGKWKIALQSFFQQLQDKYAVNPHFVHSDKDIAESKGAQAVWTTSEHQLCWWHLHKAVCSRLKQSKLGMSPYHVDIVCIKFPFIDPHFLPQVCSDPTDTKDPNLVPQRPPPPMSANSLPPQTSNPNALPIKLLIPNGFLFPESTPTTLEEEDICSSKTFCPAAYHEPIINMMEFHLCTHPLIPGECAPLKEGIRIWAVKQMYNFCYKYKLWEVWAYLWENWYCHGCWELWAWAECEEIPHLKTMMMCESQ